MHVPLIFLTELREFPSAPCLAGEKYLIGARVSMLLKLRTSPICFHSASVTRKDLQFSTRIEPSFQRHYHSALRHREVGRAKDVSEPFLEEQKSMWENMVVH